ncbi:magnesium-translocating P-type ATPase [Mucilaginibacter sp. 14171R-50]|uniref:magnesium-translocating P-type ATPase n=1 Tax=Mucilaginibacter sp. 14171R-50 TaxID=2703789 RepID=UPI00138B9208|nr:magnesium-translocating P-type ATPase [Mucilaginibacter sp. 14171R-50]QHS55318.1 magnesium-translocating P-type ATPase [Mucilaginibacter sp. 14171R-50]
MSILPYAPVPFWALEATEVFSRLSTGPAGLSSRDAAERLRKYGSNTVSSNRTSQAFVLFLAQFKSPVTILLIVASFLAAGLGDLADAIIILGIVLLSGILGFWQEKGANEAIKGLLQMVQLNCSVVRDGKTVSIPMITAVPGDVVQLSAGDMIPGDCLLLTATALFVDEAAFTGESFPVEKYSGPLPADTPLAKRFNTLFMGSHVVSGTASALIVDTGMSTEFGKLSASLRNSIVETDFERGIRKFGYLLMELTLLLVIIIFALNVWLHKPVLDSFLFSLALAVGLTPQLLPAIISVNLAAGARKMARKQVIVKRLSAIENFGSMNVLCTDKTGTITAGKVVVKDALDCNGNPSAGVLRYAWVNAALQSGFHNPIDKAICEAYQGNEKLPNAKAEIPYDFSRKRLSIQVEESGRSRLITKGAFSSILESCTEVMHGGQLMPLGPDLKNSLVNRWEELSRSGYRTLALAVKDIPDKHKIDRHDESGMTFAGFITLFDPPKPDSASTLLRLQQSGVKLKIITGDNALVAQHLAGLLELPAPRILKGPEIRQMSQSALLHAAPRTDIFAEVEPNQKERIILLLKKAGYVVGFIGDGINDAPALHAADVGISVNTAVDVAKEAADIVLLKSGLQVLLDGIEEGRKTFANTMKYVFMATSANFGNMFSMAGASLFLPFLPLLPKQVLLTNLLTDFPEMAIASDKVDSSQLSLPQRWDMTFIRKFMITFGLLSSVFDYLTFTCLLFVFHAGEREFQTGWFTESVISAVVIVLVVRTRRAFFRSLPGNALLGASFAIILAVCLIPGSPLSGWFGFVVLPPALYSWIAVLIAAYMLTAELVKHWFYKRLLAHISKKNKPAAQSHLSR